jgi:hypothetical protein
MVESGVRLDIMETEYWSDGFDLKDLVLDRLHTVFSLLMPIPRNSRGSSWPWSYGNLIYNYLCSQCLSPLMLWVRISIRARCTTLCDKVFQWFATGQGFSPGPLVSSTNKTDHHNITEILLKVALNTINQIYSFLEKIFVFPNIKLVAAILNFQLTQNTYIWKSNIQDPRNCTPRPNWDSNSQHQWW